MRNRVEAIPPCCEGSAETGGIDACAVFEGDQLVTQVGRDIPWTDIVTANQEHGETFLATPAAAMHPVLGAGDSARQPPGLPGSSCACSMTSSHTREPARRARKCSSSTIAGFPPPRKTNSRRSMPPDSRMAGSAVQRVKDLDLYASSFPVFARRAKPLP